MTSDIFQVSRIDVQQWCNILKLTSNIRVDTNKKKTPPKK